MTQRALKNPWRCSWLFLILLAVFIPSAEALQIKKVHRFHVTLAENEKEQILNFSESVDWNQTLLISQQSVGSLKDSAPDYRSFIYAGEGDAEIAVFPIDNSRAIVRRGLSYKPVNARVEALVYAVEFSDGVAVHRGITRFSPKIFSKTVIIPTINNRRAIPLIKTISSDPVTNQNEAFMFKAVFSGPNSLRLERGILPSQGRKYARAYADVYWQTIEFESGVRVRVGDAKLTNNKATTTRALYGRAINDLSQAMLFFSYMATGKARGDETVLQLRGYIESKENIRFSRARAGDKGKGVNLDAIWYVVEFDEGTHIQRGTAVFEEGEVQKDIEVTPVIVQDSLPVLACAALKSEGEGALTEAELAEASAVDQSIFHMQAELIAPDLLRISRSGSEAASKGRVQTEWQLIEFSPFQMLTPRQGEVLHVLEPYDFIWSRSEGVVTDSGVSGANHADFFLVYPSGSENQKIPLALDIPIRDQAFRMVLPPAIEKRKIAGHSLRVLMQDRRAKPKSDLNPGPFAIKGRLKLLQPSQGTVWLRDGANNIIQWEAVGIDGDIGVFYDDQGAADETAFGRSHYISKIAAGGDEVMTYLWDDMPDLFSRKMRLKVMQMADPTVYAVSGGDFSVLPVIRITSPAYGEKGWEAFSVKRVVWETNGTIPAFTLQFRAAHDQAWVEAIPSIAGGAAGSYEALWTIPGEASGPATELRVLSTDDDGVRGVFPREGGESFPIGPWIRLENLPVQGTQFKPLDALEIRWDFAGAIGLVMIEYSTDGGKSWTKQAVAEASDRVYRWTFIGFEASKVIVRISDLERPAVRDVSQNPFSVGP